MTFYSKLFCFLIYRTGVHINHRGCLQNHRLPLRLLELKPALSSPLQLQHDVLAVSIFFQKISFQYYSSAYWGTHLNGMCRLGGCGYMQNGVKSKQNQKQAAMYLTVILNRHFSYVGLGLLIAQSITFILLCGCI